MDFTSIRPEIFGELDHHLDVFTPRSAGSFPVIIFFPGMSCTVPASSYSTILQQVASWGYVVLGPWAILYNPINTYKAEWVDHVLHWAKGPLIARTLRLPTESIRTSSWTSALSTSVPSPQEPT